MRKKIKKHLCTGLLAISAAVMIWIGGPVHVSAADQKNPVSESEGVTDVGYDDLSDVLQKGGLGVVTNSQDGVATLASTYDEELLENRIVEAIKTFSTSVDVSDIGLTVTDIDNGVVRSVINSHPELISISGGYSYYRRGNNITELVFSYLENAKADQQALEKAIAEVDSKVDISGMTDEEIVLAYHEYLTSTVAYAYEDLLNGTIAENHGYDMYGTLINHSCVCQGYAETMFYFLKKAGLSCAIASSSNINHAWNIVKLHGKWYHVDATWDDPVWDMPGRSLHSYFLVSFDTMNKNTLSNHEKDRSDMVISAKWGDTYTTATDTGYESGKFWNGVNKTIFHKDGYWYSISEGASDTAYKINKYQYSTNTNKVMYSGTAKWKVSSGGYYPGVYSSIYIQGNTLYFTTPDSINKIDLSSANIVPTEIINIRTKYNSATGTNLYALGEQYGKLVYFISDSPNLKRTKDSSGSSKYNSEYAEYTFEICTSHVWDDGVVTKAPTYTSTGIKTYTCKNCGTTKTETIAKLKCTDHVWDDGVVVTAPTYKTTGVMKYTCKNCGETKTETIEKLVCTSHVWDVGVVTKAPTYTATGIKTFTCENCGETKTETIEKLECTDHVWDAGVVTKAPTYTATGIKTFTCENCGETKTETIAKLVCTSHVWDVGVVVTEPTYKTTGVMKYTCKNCGTTKTETIEKLVCTSHVWDDGVVTKAPTYTSTGIKTYTCKNCGTTKTETIEKLECTDHAWDAGVVTKAPTYTATGIKTFTCENCGETKTETIAKLVCTSHVWDVGVVTKAPTYTEAGVIKYTCTNCGETRNEEIDKLTEDVCTEHVWDTGVVVTEPTYKTTGVMKYTCKNCGETKADTIEKLVCTNHRWDDGVVTKEPTYTSTGTKKYTCENCGETKTDTIEKLECTDHAWDDSVVTKEPTYKAEGTKKYTCKNCGITKTETIAKLVCTSHVWDDGVVTKEPTYTSTGTKKYTCENCGETKTDTIDKLECTEHVWDTGVVVTEPTYKTTGVMKYTCKNCGETKTDTIEKLVCTSHKWDDGVVTKAPTYTATGIKTFTCKNCGMTKTETIAKLKLKKLTVKTGVISTGVKISWTSEKNASGYYIYRKSAKGGYSLIKKITNTKTVSFTDTKVTSGVLYTYKVQAYKDSAVGEATTASIYFVGTAKVRTANATGGVKLTWNKVRGVGSYKIYRKAGTGSYRCIRTLSAATSTYLDKTVKSGTSYTYYVKPYVKNQGGTFTKATQLYLSKVTVKTKKVKNGISLSWTKSAGAREYRIYRKNSKGKYVLVKRVNNVNTLNWTDRNTIKGKTYYYYVCSCRGGSSSANSNVARLKR